jgi:hypothetical protein
MRREAISENVKRKLYAESMGRCMNPNCQTELFAKNGDIIEKAHIDPYCKTANNSFENLVILCPTCHTNFDKNDAYTPEEVLSWKEKRNQELNVFFSKKFNSFDELKDAVTPLLMKNKTIFQNYYLGDKKELWNKFEIKVLINNRKLRTILENNFHLIQSHHNKEYSNLECIHQFLLHIDEFENTRGDKEINRSVLFPTKINSLFGIEPIDDSILQSTESLEALITNLSELDLFDGIHLGSKNPYICIKEKEVIKKIYLKDTPRLRQMYFDYKSFRRAKVHLESLNFALCYIKQRNLDFEFINYNNLRKVKIKNKIFIFVYEYCFSEVNLHELMPEENSIVVNLHNWNGYNCISYQAQILSKEIDVTLLTMTEFYSYINKLKNE